MLTPSYGSNKKTRHLIPSGHKEILVYNLSDLEVLLMHSNKYAAAVAHGVSSKKRIEILARAKALGVKWVSCFVTGKDTLYIVSPLLLSLCECLPLPTSSPISPDRLVVVNTSRT